LTKMFQRLEQRSQGVASPPEREPKPRAAEINSVNHRLRVSQSAPAWFSLVATPLPACRLTREGPVVRTRLRPPPRSPDLQECGLHGVLVRRWPTSTVSVAGRARNRMTCGDSARSWLASAAVPAGEPSLVVITAIRVDGPWERPGGSGVFAAGAIQRRVASDLHVGVQASARAGKTARRRMVHAICRT